jgi:acetoacetyl-CoA synthetase
MSRLLWEPSPERISASNLSRFIVFVNQRCAQHFTTYDELYTWSVTEIPAFWTAVWDFAAIKASRRWDSVVDDLAKMPGANWFNGARLNFAENLLRYRDDRTAVVNRTEKSGTTRLTFAELYDRVARLARSLHEAGVVPGDRVVAVLPNAEEAVVAMLATASIGGIWASCSPDYGIDAIVDRLGQLAPKVLFASGGYSYSGKGVDCLAKVAALVRLLPSLQKTVIVPGVGPKHDLSRLRAVSYDEFISPLSGLEIGFAQLPADHPLYIMFTSGASGKPRCMVQSAAGVLLNQIKELLLQTDVTRDDVVFYYTTCGWMMWNWLVCSLALGAAVVLYDGSPFYPDVEAMWRLATEEKVTVFGTSARYLAGIERLNVKPREKHDLSAIRAILSTGSALPATGFEYVYRDIKNDVLLASISGGSDINGCWAAGNPVGPVYTGELQRRCLGMKVEVYDEHAQSVVNHDGELVCTAAAPCMPLYFWNDPDGRRYREAYFDFLPGVWRHGDWARITENNGMVIYHRSDATLKPNGVRIGPAELYSRLGEINEIVDSLAVAQDWDGSERIVLFVKLRDGVALTPDLNKRIKAVIRENASPRHVPGKVVQVMEIPYTSAEAKAETAVCRTLHNEPVPNRDMPTNPAILDLYRNLEELRT